MIERSEAPPTGRADVPTADRNGASPADRVDLPTVDRNGASLAGHVGVPTVDRNGASAAGRADVLTADRNGALPIARTTVIRVFLAEDQVMIRSALVSLIELESDLEVVGVAGRGDQAVERIVELKPDVAVLDIDMPGLDGLAAAAQLAERVPRCAALILTALNKPGMLQRALQANARGFVVKHAPAEQLLAAIRGVAAGQRVFDPTLAVAALEADIPVTQRELDVVRLVAEGASAREIAGKLFLSEGTVRNYTSSLINKCGARNRVDLVRIAFDRGWL